MNTLSTCPGCGAEMKHIPAGVSKTTGKPYEAFDACSEKCGWRPPKSTPKVHREVIESRLPNSVPAPNGEHKTETMLMAYAKDLVVAMLSRDQVIGAPGKEVILIYRDLLQEIKQPNSVKTDLVQ